MNERTDPPLLRLTPAASDLPDVPDPLDAIPTPWELRDLAADLRRRHAFTLRLLKLAEAMHRRRRDEAGPIHAGSTRGDAAGCGNLPTWPESSPASRPGAHQSATPKAKVMTHLTLRDGGTHHA